MQLLLGRAAVDRMSNKHRQQDRRVAGGGDKKPRLYLILDDWDKGFSIHKIDADSFDTTTNDGLQSGVAGHLPEPPALRLESPAGHVPRNGMSFAALGTKIFAFMTQRCGLVYDSDTAVLAIGAHAPPKMLCGFGVTVAIGEVIYALTYRFFEGQHSFEAMSWEHPTEGWSWKTLPPPPSAFRSRVNSYVLHPDGCTIFMTTANNGCLGTYSFNTKDSAWRWHGEWALPFVGQAHFDGETNSWVGLRWDGYICSCKVVSPDCLNTAPDWQMTKEKLFHKDRQRHMRASLTSMGTNRFCLVQCVKREEVGEGPALGDHDGCVLHLTIFGLKYNHKGELQTTDHHQSTRSFIVSRYRDHFAPIAFWM